METDYVLGLSFSQAVPAEFIASAEFASCVTGWGDRELIGESFVKLRICCCLYLLGLGVLWDIKEMAFCDWLRLLHSTLWILQFMILKYSG